MLCVLADMRAALKVRVRVLPLQVSDFYGTVTGAEEAAPLSLGGHLSDPSWRRLKRAGFSSFLMILLYWVESVTEQKIFFWQSFSLGKTQVCGDGRKRYHSPDCGSPSTEPFAKCFTLSYPWVNFATDFESPIK